ncbi:MAG: methyltransferase domain-containing protein [Bdellovibrionales bacterium]|nr:methyltransferase domain-containing protein [Bdellovibrionales bacterium]
MRNEKSTRTDAPTVWRLRPGLEKKFAKGHPWVFSNDLDQSPKGHPPGGMVELRDSRDQFLGFGYGNPSTLISFRLLSRTPVVNLEELLRQKFSDATKARNLTGMDRFSHRMIFGEADGLPGIIVDRYLIDGGERQVFVVQSSTAGSDQLLPAVTNALREFPHRDLAFRGRGSTIDAKIIKAQDSSARAMEGLTKLPREVMESGTFDGRRATIQVQLGESANSELAVEYDVDFIDGQKTGFFLDQRMNVRLSWPSIATIAKEKAATRSKLKVLDLFCYVGQWSVQIAACAKKVGAETDILLADASAPALELAAHNARRAGGNVTAKKMDILAEIGQLPVGGYDVVVCDPPAFIKKKKDHPTGRAAYVKLNREAIKRVAPGGLFVSCSCSGLLTDEEFVEVLADAKRLSGRDILWVAHGGHGEDHPSRSEFPQGRYLKGWVGIVI